VSHSEIKSSVLPLEFSFHLVDMNYDLNTLRIRAAALFPESTSLHNSLPNCFSVDPHQGRVDMVAPLIKSTSLSLVSSNPLLYSINIGDILRYLRHSQSAVTNLDVRKRCSMTPWSHRPESCVGLSKYPPMRLFLALRHTQRDKIIQ